MSRHYLGDAIVDTMIAIGAVSLLAGVALTVLALWLWKHVDFFAWGARWVS